MDWTNRTGGVGKDPRKHAVILSGGGAKGAYEIGVMKALFPGYVRCVSDGREVDPVVYAGTSVGAFNAAYMVSCAQQDTRTALAGLESIWRNRIASSNTRPNGVLRFRANPLEGMEVDRLLADPFAPMRNFLMDGAFFAKDAIERGELFFKSQEALSRRAIQLLDFSAFVATDRLRDLIKETIDLKQVRGNADRAVMIAATNWEAGVVKLFGNLKPEGELSDLRSLDDKIGHLAILASTAIPGVFPQVEIYHTKYVDGGLLLNTPLAPSLKALRAIAPQEKEYVVHVIYLDPDLKDVPIDQGNNTMDALNRFAALNFASQVNRDIKQAKHINQAIELLHTAEKRMDVLKESGRMILESLPEDARLNVSFLVGDALENIQKPFKSLVKNEEAEYRPITIHRYHPRSTFAGVFGLLAFESDFVGHLIEQGFQDAVTHNCEDSGCIFPTCEDVLSAKQTSREMKAAATRKTVPASALD